MIRLIVLVLRPLLMVVTRRDWQGAANLPEGGFVLAPNHLSHVDPILISHFMVDHGITPRFLAKDTIMRARGVGWVLRKAAQIPVYRSTDGATDSMRAAVQAVRDGEVVTIYPEGTITRDPDVWPMSGKTGAVRVALAAGMPLVPVMQWGPQEILWPYSKRLRLLPRRTIHVRVGDPVDLDDLHGKELTEPLLREATDRLMDALTAMMAEVRGELPSGERIDIHTLAKPRTTYKPKEI